MHNKKLIRQWQNILKMPLLALLVIDQEMIFNFMNNLNSALISKNNSMIIKMRAALMMNRGLISKEVQIYQYKTYTQRKTKFIMPSKSYVIVNQDKIMMPF